MRAGVVQPRDLMEKVLPQLDAVIKPTAEESIFWSPIRTMPNTIGAEDKARISAEYKRMIELRIMPAYRALRGFIATEYLPATRTSSGRARCPMAGLVRQPDRADHRQRPERRATARAGRATRAGAAGADCHRDEGCQAARHADCCCAACATTASSSTVTPTH